MIASAVFLLHSSARTRAPQLGITGKPPAVRRYPAVRASARFRLQSAVRWKRSGAPAKPYFAALPGLGGSRLTCLYDSKGTPGGPTGLHAPQLGITGKPPAVRRYPAVRASARFRLQSAVRWKRADAR